jgi:hypothetical protein
LPHKYQTIDSGRPNTQAVSVIRSIADIAAGTALNNKNLQRSVEY